MESISPQPDTQQKTVREQLFSTDWHDFPDMQQSVQQPTKVSSTVTPIISTPLYIDPSNNLQLNITIYDDVNVSTIDEHMKNVFSHFIVIRKIKNDINQLNTPNMIRKTYDDMTIIYNTAYFPHLSLYYYDALPKSTLYFQILFFESTQILFINIYDKYNNNKLNITKIIQKILSKFDEHIKIK